MNGAARQSVRATRRSGAAATGIALVLLAGCGTTVSGAGTQGQAGSTSQGALQVTSPRPTTASTGLSGPAAAPSGAAGSIAGSGSAPGNSAAVTSSDNSGSGGSRGNATTARGPVKVGFLVSDYTKTAAAFKASGASDPQQWNRYLVKYYNAHGGLAGRQISPVYYTIDGASADYNTEDQAACTSFTQDSHVEMVLSNLWVNQALTTCLLHAGVPQIEGTVVTQNTEGMLAQTPNLFLPSGMALDRVSDALITEAVRLGVLTKKDKLGLLYDSCPYSVHAAKEAAIPTAQRLGIPIDPDEFSQCGSGFDDAGRFTQDVTSAEFRMRQDNVTTVMFLTQGEGGAMTFFGKDADSQHWYPKYLVSSNVLMTSNETEGPAAMPQDQAKNVHGFGWDPSLDSDKAYRNPTPQMKACVQQARAAGGTAPTTVNDTLTLYAACNAISFAAAALHASGGAGGLAAMRPAIEHLGTSFVSTTTAGGKTRFSPSRHDGAYLVRPFVWQADCSCFGYAGPPHQVP